jgi:hypothetical protein
MPKKKQEQDWEKEDKETVLAKGGEWTKKINVDIPMWVVKELDKEADRVGIARQALIKMWIVEKVDQIRAKKTA